MKKWAVLVLVLLGGALLAMQYIMNQQKPGPQPTAQPSAPTGVELPPDATGYAQPGMPPPTMDDRGDPRQINIPDLPFDFKGACPNSSLADMKASHGKIWGILATETPFDRDDTRRMYGFVADYIGCVAVAHDKATLCNSLPPEPPPGGKPGETPQPPQDGKMPGQTPTREPEGAGKPNARDGLRYNCRKRVNPVLFIAFMAGKSKSTMACQAVLAGMKPSTLAKINATDFCAAAEKGMEAVTEYMSKTKKKKKVVKERQAFATNEAACRGNKECLNGVALYNAIKSGDPKKCPKMMPRKDDRKGAPSMEDAASTADTYCAAAISKSAVSCEPIIREMSKFYCSAMEKTKKRTGGYAGMTKEEIAADLARKKAEQAEAEKRRKEDEARGKEINANLKKLLGKE